jgi:hypothetical protein
MKRTPSVVGDEKFTRNEKNSERGAQKRLNDEEKKHEEVRDKKESWEQEEDEARNELNIKYGARRRVNEEQKEV